MTSNTTAAAEAIYSAFLQDNKEMDHVRADRLALAAVLRATANQVTPVNPMIDPLNRWRCCERRELEIREQLLLIADEFDGVQYGTYRSSL